LRVINAIEAANLIVRDLTRKGIRFAMGGDAPSGEQKEALSVEMSLANTSPSLGDFRTKCSYPCCPGSTSASFPTASSRWTTPAA